VSFLGTIAIDTGVPWDAIATGLAGTLAVVGAFWVGLIQVRIASRQADIAQKQAELQANLIAVDAGRLKSELFDRRYEVFEATQRFLADLVASGKYPIPAVDIEFVAAVNKSKFLFSVSVNHALFDLLASARVYKDEAARSLMEQDPVQREQLLAAATRRLSTLRLTLDTLGMVFGDELRLGALDIKSAFNRTSGLD
jgi:hypothetical protein